MNGRRRESPSEDWLRPRGRSSHKPEVTSAHFPSSTYKTISPYSWVLGMGAFTSLCQCTSSGWKATPHEKALSHNQSCLCLAPLLHGCLPASVSTSCMQTIRDRALSLWLIPNCHLVDSVELTIGMCVPLGIRKHPKYEVTGSQSCHDVDTLVLYPW